MKAVLVIDMPNRCSECPLCSKDENYCGDIVSAECQMQYKGYLTLNEMEKPTWCPLKLLPRRMSMRDDAEFYLGYMNGKTKYLGFNEGYNACLEDITGDTE